MRTRSASRLLAAATPLALALLVSACGDIKGADDREFYVKPPLDEPGLTVTPERPTAMDELGTPRAHVPQTEANFIAPARPAPRQGTQPGAQQGAQPGAQQGGQQPARQPGS